MGGGASSQASKKTALAEGARGQPTSVKGGARGPGPRSPDRSPSTAHGGKKESPKASTDSPRLSPRGSPRLSPREPYGVGDAASGAANQIESPVVGSRDMSRRSSDSSMHDGHSDGINEENMDYLAFSAMSLGMDNDELLFNMFYFGDEGGTGFRQSMNTAIEETYAAHSTGNTPYKLRPATEDSINKHLSAVVDVSDVPEAEECLICQERLRDEEQGPMSMITTCKHVFHEQCVLRWFTLQNWCPVCRAVICNESKDDVKAEKSGGGEHNCVADFCSEGCESPAAVSDWCGPRNMGAAPAVDV